LIELLIVLAIIAILAILVIAVVDKSRKEARDVRIRNDVGQLRWEAEIVYDTQGASYLNWSQHSLVLDNIQTLLGDIDAQSGDSPGPPHVTVIRESQSTDYCISAPLRAEAGLYTCVDATGEVRETSSHCPDDPDGDGDPVLRCPSS
jgi:type II secretory pathway pseudopilin PulG